MTEGSGGNFDDNGQPDTPQGNWETLPKSVNDISQVPVHKLDQAFQKRGTRVDAGAPVRGVPGIPAQVNRISVESMPKYPWWQFWNWGKKPPQEN